MSEIDISEKDKEIRDRVLDAYKSAYHDRHRLYKEEIWRKCYRNYMGILEKRIPRRSNLFIPVTYQTIETMVAREMSILYDNNGIFSFEARKKEDVDAAEALSMYANYDLRRVPNSYHKMSSFVRNLHIYGTSIMKVNWEYDYTEDENGDLITKYDGFNFDNVPARNFFIDPRARKLSDARFVITRTIMDKADVKELIEKTEFRKTKEEALDSVSNSSYIVGAEGTFISDLDNFDSLTFDKDRELVEILEYWSEPDDEYTVVAGGQLVLKTGKMPLKHKKYPFLVAHDTPDPEHFWGLATAESIFDLQDELNATRNHRMDKKNFTMNPMFLVSHDSMLKREELFSRQGGVIKVRDVNNDIKPIELGRMDSSDYNEESIIKQDIQTTSSINDFALGQTSKGFNDTATGISIIDQNAQSRIISKVAYIEKEVIEPMADMWLKLQQQFMQPREMIMVTGKEVIINRDMTVKDYDVKSIAIARAQNKQQRQNAVMQLAQLVTNDPMVNHGEWLQTVFSAFDIPAGKLIKDPSEIPPMPPVQGQGVQGAQQANPNVEAQTGGLRADSGSGGHNFITGQQV